MSCRSTTKADRRPYIRVSCKHTAAQTYPTTALLARLALKTDRSLLHKCRPPTIAAEAFWTSQRCAPLRTVPSSASAMEPCHLSCLVRTQEDFNFSTWGLRRTSKLKLCIATSPSFFSLALSLSLSLSLAFPSLPSFRPSFLL